MSEAEVLEVCAGVQDAPTAIGATSWPEALRAGDGQARINHHHPQHYLTDSDDETDCQPA